MRRTALTAFLLFGLVLVNLNYLQVVRARSLAEDPRNSRGLLESYEVQRGAITAGRGDGRVEIAHSIETDDQLRYLRVYPDGPLYAHITGFDSFVFGRAQLERTYHDFLVGAAPESFIANVVDLLSGRPTRGDTVVTTIRPQVQAAAAQALGGQRGAVVALDPRDGTVLALVSSPSYDPNVLSSHDNAAIRGAWEQLETDPANPRLSRATGELFRPGSTFKVITAAAALAAGLTPESTVPDVAAVDLPQTDATITNAGGGLCGSGGEVTLQRGFERSCNTVFAQIALDLGADRLVEAAEAFGFNNEMEFDVPTAISRIPAELDPPQTAQSAIGERDVRATALQMALAAGAVGNGGVLMAPRLVTEVQDFEGRVVRQFPATPLELPGADGAQVVSPAVAVQLRQLMIGVVTSGTGTAAAIDGFSVAGKTGTAQAAGESGPTAWFVGFSAPSPSDPAHVVVAVVVEDGGAAGDAGTGGRVAAPIARTVMQAALQG